MSVLVPGVKMPGNCHECDSYGISDLCWIPCPCSEDPGRYSYDGRPEGCLLIEVKPHGRLIDADVLTERLERGENSSLGQAHAYYRFAKAWVKEAPTIIPAEGGGDHAEEV